MIWYGFSVLIALSFPAWSQTDKGLERMNFFPQAAAFAAFGHEYGIQNIDTPHASVQTKEVHNYYNALNASYAQRIMDSMFLGLAGQFELGSENGVSYGIPTRKRFTSSGFREPEAFLIWRLREQKEERGLIDLRLSYAHSFGAREIGGDGANRLNGRDLFRGVLSHGLWEEEWEFRSAFEWHYYGKGEEHNSFTNTSHRLDPKNNFLFHFSVQYKVDDWNFPYALIGVVFRETEEITDGEGDHREIQAGTGTLFQAGWKRPLGQWALLQLQYSLLRSEYFVKAEDANLDGDETEQQTALTLLYAF